MTTTPQDHLKPAAERTHTFTHNGESYTIPAISALPVGVTRKARKAKDEADQVFIMLEESMGEDSAALAAVDTMTPEEFQTFLEGWTQGAGVGEA